MSRLTKEEIEMYEELERQFMRPDLNYVNRRCRYELSDMFPDGEGPQGRDAWAGWYARMSAPGYLDLTEWSGPFKSKTAAKRYLIDTYGNWD